MKVLVVSQYFWPEQFLINDLVVALNNKGHEVEVLTAEPNYPAGYIYKEYKDDKSKFDNYKGVKIHRCRVVPRGKTKFSLIANYLSFMFSSSFKVVSELRKGGFDIVLFFQLSPVFSGLPAILYKKLFKVPLITWVQDLWPESLSATGQVNNEKVIETIRVFVRYLYDSSDLIYIQSKWFESKVRKDCSNEPSISYLPNWADKSFENKSFLNADFYQKKEGYFDFLFAGNMGEAQDLDNLVLAVSLLPVDIKFRIVMLGDGNAKSRIEMLAKSNNIDSKFLFLGRKDIKYMPSAFNKADALIVSLKDEDIFRMTVPSKVQSYLAAGRPIIASISGAGAEVILDSKAGLIAVPGDAVDLAAKMNEMLCFDNDVLDEMSEQGRKYYHNNFSFSHVCQTINDDMMRLRS